MERALSMAQDFAAMSPTIMALGRQSLMRANGLDYRRNAENQSEALCMFGTRDGRDGLTEFLEKRKPNWL
jgi:enoyl-CoA hydratase/carnithine racemase